MATESSLGDRLRLVRQQKGFSLAQVAKATDISASFLSLVETGKNDITIKRLMRLVEFYDVSLMDVLEPRTADSVVVRRDLQPRIHSSAEGIDVWLLAPDTSRK